jgi:arabinogalactan oligomer/maltooligosaccharide transport system substrate-binding protein
MSPCACTTNKFRSSLRNGILALCALALAAPARGADLVIWSSYTAREKSGLEQLVAKYNARRGAAGPRVKVVNIPFDVLGDRIASAIPRRQGPDLFVYSNDRLGGWVEAGNIVAPLTGLLEPSTRDRFLAPALQAVSYQSVVYGLPLNLKVLALFYNRNLVEQPPRTTAELAVMAKNLTDRRTGVYGFTYLYSNYWWHAALQNGFGGRVFDRAGLPVLDSPENLKAMHLLLAWQDGFLPENPLRDFSRSLFNQGKLAMIIEGPWFLGEINSAIDIGVAPLPQISEANDHPMQPWFTVDGLFVSAASEQKEAAYQLAKFLTDVPAAKVMALEGTQLPSNQRAYMDPILKGNEVLGAFIRQVMVSSAPMPNGPEMTLMWAPITAAMQSILTRSATPEAALAKAQAQLAKSVAKLRKTPATAAQAQAATTAPSR